MKKLKDIIVEKLRLTKNKVQEYNYHPKTKEELSTIIWKKYKNRKDDILNLNDIDISKIEDLSYLFEHIHVKTIDINEWDVRRVKDIHGLFWTNDTVEEIHIEDWDVSNIESTYGAFYFCTKIKELNLDNWEFNKCTEFDLMFKGCENLDTHFTDNWKMPIHPITADEMFEGCKYIPKWYKK